jgi:protein FRA10AC1
MAASSHKRPAPSPQDDHSRKIFRNTLKGESAWDRHKQYVTRYLNVYERDGGKARLAKVEGQSRNDWDVLKERHRFLRDDEDTTVAATNISATTQYENEVAKRYYNHLFKEYAIADLKHYKTAKLALRWRSEDEVVEGIGQFSE